MRDFILVIIGLIIGILGVKYGFIQYIFPIYLIIIIGLVVSIEIDRRKEQKK